MTELPELTRDVFVELWKSTKAGRTLDNADVARLQKFMSMHADLHSHFEQLEQDPAAPLEVPHLRGENVILHIAMDAATERALELNEPAGVRDIMQEMLADGLQPAQAFHVISQAMQHEFVTAMSRGDEVEPDPFLTRARAYAEQARKLREA